MDLRFSDEDEAFRAEARDFLETHLTGDFGALRGLGGPGKEHQDFEGRLEWEKLLGKDRVNAAAAEGDFMRGKGTHDPGRNPNSYPMTDADRTPSAVRVVVNGVPAGVFDLPDDPADHRGLRERPPPRHRARPWVQVRGLTGQA